MTRLLRRAEAFEQPLGVRIGRYDVPVAADNERWRHDPPRIVGEAAGVGLDDVGHRPVRNPYARRRSRRARRVGGEVSRAPLIEVRATQGARLPVRNAPSKARPLVVERHVVVCRHPSGRGGASRACYDWAEEDEPLDPIRVLAREQPGRHRPPGMGHQTHPRGAPPPGDLLDGQGDLAGGVAGPADGCCSLRRPLHLGIAVRAAVACEVQGPRIDAVGCQLVHPRAAVQAIGCRQGRREGRPVDDQHCWAGGLSDRGLVSQEQPNGSPLSLDPDQLLGRSRASRRQRRGQADR